MIRDVLLALSGADRELLLRDAPRDRVKYEGIGSAVLLTASMAAVSSGIALRMALDLWLPVAVVAGLLWGLGMLLLDRWLVSANQRQDSKILTVFLALPRVALALSIGVVMSTPLVLQVFSPEIAARLAQEHQTAKADVERQLDADPRFASLQTDRAALDQARRELAGGTTSEQVYQDVAVAELRQQVADSRQRLADAEMELVCERDGTCGSAQAGRGPAYEEKRAVFARAEQELPRLEAALATAEEQVRERLGNEAGTREAQLQQQAEALVRTQQDRDEAQRLREAAIDADDGVLARLEALHTIGEERPAMQSAHLALFVFLTFIECLPVLIKLLLSFGKPTLYEQLSTAADADTVRAARLAAEAEYEIARLRRDADRREVEQGLQKAQLAADLPHGLDLMRAATVTQIAEDERRAELQQRREELRIEVDLRLRQRRLSAEREDWDALTPLEQAERLSSTALQLGPEGRVPEQNGPKFRRRPRGIAAAPHVDQDAGGRVWTGT